MRNRKNILFSIKFIIIILLFFISCKKEKPALTIPEDKLIKVFHDLHTAKYIINKAPVDIKDSLTQVYTAQIFTNHKVDKREFEKNLQLLQKYPKYYSRFYDKLNHYSDSLMQKSKVAEPR